MVIIPMVTKTITIADGIYDSIRDNAVLTDRPFSAVVQNYIKLGMAYEQFLKIQEEGKVKG